MSNRDINIMGKSIKEAQETLKNRKDIAYGNEPSTHELFMNREGKTFVQAITNEGDDINTLTAGTIITSEQPLEDDNTIQLIQSFYETRRG